MFRIYVVSGRRLVTPTRFTERDGDIHTVRLARVMASSLARATTTRSTSTSRDVESSTPRARRVVARATDERGAVLYFAYGSNMNVKTFQGMRAMKPTRSIAVVLRGYELAFNVPGVPYVEPAFASVREARADATARFERECHGVAHKITSDEWEYLVRTEGSYDVIDVECETYEGERLKCRTLSHRTLPNFGEQLASVRYMTLLREGARYHGIDADYCEYLDALEAYEPVKLDLMQCAALGVSVGPTLLAAAPAAASAATRGLAAGDGRKALIDAFVETQDVLWGVNNMFFAPWMGGGGQNSRRK